MSDINELIIEAMVNDLMNSPFQMSSTDPGYSYEDKKQRLLTDKLKHTLGMSANVAGQIVRRTNGTGGPSKYYNKPDIDVEDNMQQSKKVRKETILKFNKIMGEKVL